MTLTEMESLFYTMYREKSTNTSVAAAIVDGLINRAYGIVSSSVSWTYHRAKTSLSVAYSKLTGAMTADTTVNVTDGTNFWAGQEICVTNGSRYDYAVVTSKLVNALTLTSPGIPFDHPVTAYCIGSTYKFPSHLEIMGVVFRRQDATNYLGSRIEGVGLEQQLKQNAYPTVKGTPGYWVPMLSSITNGQEFKILPLPESTGYIDVYYRSLVADLTASDSPAIDTIFHPAIVYLALSLIAVRDRDQGLFQLSMQLYMAFMKLANEIMAMRSQAINENFQFPVDMGI